MAEKKGLIHRFIVGKDRDENYARSTLPSNRWELLWDVIKGRFWKNVLLNLMLIIAFIPTVFILFRTSLLSAEYGTLLPFSGSLFTGYPFIPDLYNINYVNELQLQVMSFTLLIPCLLFASLIMSGVFYIVRNLVWSESVFIANDFWKGFKQNALYFMLITFILGLVYFVSAMNVFIIDNNFLINPDSFFSKPFVSNLFKALIIIMAGFVTIMALFAYTITVTYKVKFRQLIKNSFYLTLGLLPRNIVMAALSFSPFLLLAIFGMNLMFLSSILLGIVLLLGFTLAIIGWSIYSHWVFDKFINDRVEGAVKNRGIYSKIGKDGKPVNKKEYFKNPKKKKAVKPVTDEEIAITELPVNYSRADLERLAKEKEFIKKDSEKWAEEHSGDEYIEEDFDSGDVMDEEDYYEGYQDAMKLEGYDSEIEEQAIVAEEDGEDKAENNNKEGKNTDN
ncbi:MAG: hypothetical protein PHE12_03140 [Clostridia bacterium]|nr:hypothetical protein [Clostridia bacterium]